MKPLLAIALAASCLIPIAARAAGPSTKHVSALWAPII